MNDQTRSLKVKNITYFGMEGVLRIQIGPKCFATTNIVVSKTWCCQNHSPFESNHTLYFKMKGTDRTQGNETLTL